MVERTLAWLSKNRRLSKDYEFSAQQQRSDHPLGGNSAHDALVGKTQYLIFIHSLTDVPQVFTYERDPRDEKYINLAIASNAHYLVSRDKDLLDLRKEDLPEGQGFRAQFPSLQILDPVDFLKQIILPREDIC